eukprot:Polyplicarium_translucidae@DN2661_c0_g1_i6.p3
MWPTLRQRIPEVRTHACEVRGLSGMFQGLGVPWRSDIFSLSKRVHRLYLFLERDQGSLLPRGSTIRVSWSPRPSANRVVRCAKFAYLKSVVEAHARAKSAGVLRV